MSESGVKEFKMLFGSVLKLIITFKGESPKLFELVLFFSWK